MAQWFEVKASYDKTLENGTVKKVTEPYLFDSLSFTDAESRAIEELTPFMSGEFSVRACKRTKISEIFNIGAERYYLAKVAFITIDERTAVEKRSMVQILVGAHDFTDAIEEFNKGMKDSMADFELISLSETQIMDVYPAKL